MLNVGVRMFMKTEWLVTSVWFTIKSVFVTAIPQFLEVERKVGQLFLRLFWGVNFGSWNRTISILFFVA